MFNHFYEYSNNGGVICIIDQSTNFLIEDVSFYSCYCSLLGGVIYFKSTTNGNFVLNKICASNCSVSYEVTSSFSFSRIECLTVKIHSISINKCPNNLNFNQKRVLTCLYGQQEFKNLNISNNNLYEHSGFDSYNNNIVNISFINLYKNLVGSSITCYFPYGIRNINNLVIINCNSPLAYGQFYVSHSGQLYFNNCLFYNNTNYLFSISSSLIYISNSVLAQSLDSNNYIYHSNSNNFYSLTFFKTFHHFNTYYCNINLIVSSNLKNNTLKYSFFVIIFIILLF